MRTLAGDLAASQKNQTVVPADSVVPKPKNEPVSAPENFVYKSPTARAPVPPPKPISANKPAEEIPVPKKLAVPKPIPQPPTPSLKPLSAPKKASEPTIIVNNDDHASAAIIRDTKHNRFRLLPEIGTSLNSWFSGIKERYFTKKAPKYTVPEVTHRKGVIQKATSLTGKVATFDTASIQDRIRARRERTAPKTPVTIWTGNTEPGFALLEAPEETTIPEPPPRITNVQVVPRKSINVAEKKVVAPVFTEPAPTPKPIPTPIAPPNPEPVLPTPTPKPAPVETAIYELETTLPEVTPTPLVTDLPEPDTDTSPATTIEPTSPPVTKLKPKGYKEWLFILNTNLLSAGMILLFLAVFIVGVVAYQWSNRLASDDLIVVTSPSHSALAGERLQLLFSPTLETEQLLALIRDNHKNSPYHIFELALTFDQAGNQLLPASSVFAGLRWSAHPLLAQSVTAVRFGSISQETPFVIMQVPDPVSARGSLLAWEPTLLRDFIPLFYGEGTTVATNAQTSFRDVIIESVDTRLLISSAGDGVLIYTIQGNLIIITTSESALRTLLTATKK